MNVNTVIIGSGCAGFNAADWLYDLGVKDILLVTEGINMGTSRNTGSDKQTYYKLTLAGGEPDSIHEMATTLFEGGSVHGDIAMAEAASSAKAFMKLVNLGLPFPCNQYGAYVGYKTDHDPRQRATSCGPLTSRYMTEALEKSVMSKGIKILDNSQAVKLLTHKNKHKNKQETQICGIVILDKATNKYQTISCKNVILATGGPAAIYQASVYPASQTGATGLALDAGAAACNLSEWQYGLASIDFRWNVSGTYQQVLPRYISVDDAGNQYEFLSQHFKSPQRGLDMVFLKGYQWPFDVQKINGSSQIDLLVAKEINEKGRKVYMDFTQNPTGLDFSALSEETYTYLKRSEALFGTPIERLAKMNPKAIDLYKNNGIDLYKHPLRIAMCAQHCNGGIAVDANWQSNINGLYAVGEAAGTFGVYRPGGSALNSAQVGSMRAAEHIAKKAANDGQKEGQTEIASITEAPVSPPPAVNYSENPTAHTNFKATQHQMSKIAAYTRNLQEMKKLHSKLLTRKAQFFTQNSITNETELSQLHKYYDTLVTQVDVLSAMIFAAENIGSRGSALVENMLEDTLEDIVKDTTPDNQHNDKVVTTTNSNSYFEPVRPLPPCNDWFETVWNDFNKN